MRVDTLARRLEALEARLAQRKPYPTFVMVPPDRACTALYANGKKYERRQGEALADFMSRVEAATPPSFAGCTVINFSPPDLGGM